MIEFPDGAAGWRPSWAEMLDLVDRFNRNEESAEEVRWLRSHPTDWLMVARYMQLRTQNHIAESRKKLKEIEVTDPETGRPRWEYLNAKNSVEKLTQKRLHWLAGVEAQIAEAKYIIGHDKIDWNQCAELIDQLLKVRAALQTDQIDTGVAVNIIEGLLRVHGGDVGLDLYRPRNSKEQGGEG
jgi:hypothetical protein